MQPPMTRILIADDHEVVRSGLRKILESQPKWEVVGEASDGKEAVAKALELKPDIAVLDYALPLVNGIEATRQIRARLPRTEVLIFTMHDNETAHPRPAGCRRPRLSAQVGCIPFPAGGDRVASAAQAVLHGQGLGSFARLLPQAAGPRPVRAHAPRTRRRSADRGRAQQQADRQRAQHQPQDRGDAPRSRDAKAQPVIRRPRSCAMPSATKSSRPKGTGARYLGRLEP